MKQDSEISRDISKADHHELPSSLQPTFKKAKKLEWITVAYLVSVGVVMFLAMQSSQAMKAAWIEDVVSLFPSIAFLIAARFYNKAPDKDYPYGYHKAFTVAFAGGSLALLILGLYVLYGSVMSLIRGEHPTIGSVVIFGHMIWMGWLMILALLYSFIPAMILGRKKLPFAKKLHIKVLFVDSQAQKADWMTAGAAIVGIIGIGFGLWWADAVAAIFISLSVVNDGISRSRDAMKDLMEEMPKTYDNKNIHPVVKELHALASKQEWVKKAQVRMREHGMVFFGDIYIIPVSEEQLMDNIDELVKKAKSLDWKIEDLVVHPVRSFPNPNIRYRYQPEKNDPIKAEAGS